MIYDLHTHSNVSDGILSPTELVSRANLKGVTHLALTDHDTLGGISEAQAAANDYDLQLIPGIELSCQWQGINIHIVGLNVNIDSAELNKLVETQVVARATRAEEIARRLAKEGIQGALEGAQKHAGSSLIGRPHFARYLIEIGAVTSVNQAFKKFLGAGKAGDVKQVWPEVVEAVSLLLRSKATPILAHPLRYNVTLTKLRRLLDDFKQAGGMGLEVLSGKQSINETKTALGLVSRFELMASCGSDFHVPDQPWQELGCFGKLPPECTPVWQAWR